MKFYNNIFASTYRFYSKFKNESPLGSAICVVFVCQITIMFLLLIILGKIIGIKLFATSKYYYLPIFLGWLYYLFKYYSKEKAQIILEEYNTKSLSTRRFWAILTLLSFVVPILFIFIALIKFR